jgi:hypothetical protein
MDVLHLVVGDESAVRDEGSVIVLEGVDDDGDVYWFACDRRPALDIIHALQSGYETEIDVFVEPWQIVGSAR